MEKISWKEYQDKIILQMYKDPDYRPEDMLRDLLAVIHGDGGHHTEEVGLEQSVIDAGNRVSEDRHGEDEMDFLVFFYTVADFGPAHGDVMSIIREKYEEQTGRPVPRGYKPEY